MGHDEVAIKIKHLKEFINIDIDASMISGIGLRRRSRFFKILTIVLSALVTIVLGLSDPDIYSRIALVLSSCITGLSTWDSFSKYERRHTQELSNNNALTSLLKEIILYESGNSNMTPNKFNEFEQNYRRIQEEYMEDRKKSITSGAPDQTASL